VPSTSTPAASNPSPTSAPSSTDANAQDAEARKIFDQLDTNHDGILTLDEFSRATIRAK
jgi:Ca2+-binding EF-hand superfamily protein